MKEKSKSCIRWVKQDVFLRILFCCLLAVLFMSLSPFGLNTGHSATVTLAWNKNAETNIAGYKASYGTSSGSYTTTVDVGNYTSCTLSGLQEGKTYYFAAKAYNTSGVESSYSSPVSYTVPLATTSPTPTTTSTTSTVTTYYKITASYGSGGYVSPYGTISAASGTSKTFYIKPNSGYVISGVYVDGSYIGKPTSYTFTNVKANHTISAKFSASTSTTTSTTSTVTTYYKITASYGSGGYVSPYGTVSAASGTSKTFYIKPNSGYVISGVYVDGSYIGKPTSYTFTNVKANHTISAKFSASTSTTTSTTSTVTTYYKITASAGSGGYISPSGSVSVASGGSKTFSITPASGRYILAVYVNGSYIGKPTSYTFSNVKANHTITAAFR